MFPSTTGRVTDMSYAGVIDTLQYFGTIGRVKAFDRGGMIDDQLTCAASFDDGGRAITGVTVECFPASFAGHLVKRDDALAASSDHRVNQVAVDQADAPRIPRWVLPRKSLL